MGLSDGLKSLQIGLAVLIQYRSVTDTHPASIHPARHVAVAITLNAKASSLKSSGTFFRRLGTITGFFWIQHYSHTCNNLQAEKYFMHQMAKLCQHRSSVPNSIAFIFWSLNNPYHACSPLGEVSQPVYRSFFVFFSTIFAVFKCKPVLIILAPVRGFDLRIQCTATHYRLQLKLHEFHVIVVPPIEWLHNE